MRGLAILLCSAPTALGALWTQRYVADAPQGRSGAAGVQVNGGALLVHGGCTSSCCYAPLDDAWLLSPSGKNWTLLGTGASPRLNHLAVPGAAPGSALIFGGSDVVSGFLNDLWKVSVSESGATWERLSANGAAPIASRGSHAGVALPSAGTDAFLVYGGINADAVLGDAWTYVGGRWTRVRQTGGPGPRAQHTLVASSSPSTNGDIALWLFGGSDGGGTDHADLWQGNLSIAGNEASLDWTQLSEDTSAPLSPRQ